MRLLTRAAAAAVLGSTLTAAAVAQAPPGATPPAAAPAAPPAAAPVVRPAGTAATVNGQAVPEVAVYRSLRQFPPAYHETARKEIVNHLVENTLIDQYLTALKVAVGDQEVATTLTELKKELADAKKDFAKELEAMVLTEDEFKVEVAAQMKWEAFVKGQATDDNLKKLFESSPDVFDGSMVRARHVLINPGPDAAKQAEATAKLKQIKANVEAEAAKAEAALPPTADPLAKAEARGKKAEELFMAYAKEHSSCPSKKDGGDLNFFPRAGAMVEPFAKAAFALQPYQMSEVVPTEFGLHLIMVTAKKPGAPKKFEEVKEEVRLLYAMRLREAVIAQMKPKAQITINAAPAPLGTPAPVPVNAVPTGNPAPAAP